MKDQEVAGQRSNQCVVYRSMKEPSLCEELKVVQYCWAQCAYQGVSEDEGGRGSS